MTLLPAGVKVQAFGYTDMRTKIASYSRTCGRTARIILKSDVNWCTPGAL